MTVSFPDDHTFTEPEAAAFLRMTPRMLAMRRRAGKIRFRKDGRYIVYTKPDLLAYRDGLQESVECPPQPILSPPIKRSVSLSETGDSTRGKSRRIGTASATTKKKPGQFGSAFVQTISKRHIENSSP